MIVDYVCALSITLNAILVSALIIKCRPIPKKTLADEILEILHDISSAGTILEIRRVDPMHIFTVSPHDRGK